MKLVEITSQEFEKDIYPEYVKLFPLKERKKLEHLQNGIQKQITQILKIEEEKVLVGFMILNRLAESKMIHLDYFAILPQYQSKGYGKTAISLLTQQVKSCLGILIEIEKVGKGITELENRIREKRAKFYERLGFKQMEFEVELNTVVFSTYYLPFLQQEVNREKLVQDLKKVYQIMIGNQQVNQIFRVIT